VKFDADASSEIKSVLSFAKQNFTAQQFHSAPVEFRPSARTDLAEKAHCRSSELFLVGDGGFDLHFLSLWQKKIEVATSF